MSATDTLISLPDENATRTLAQTLARAAQPGDCLLLRGDLGAGKTTFAQGFIRALAPAADVTSPTFNLVQTYPAHPATIWHFDLYRLKTPAELPEIGLEEALENGITLVEWPEIAEGHFPAHALTIQLAMHGEGRTAALSGQGHWQPILTTLNG
ncbi:MAG: tRNA (adenosine(37)-N6)-threonylcarbamoyltransferase complex ATPase subunit type 1 TsaE [Rickettsiales bacterium]|nr:tRNA (adenosine(37)-N6)-threonylcarbamoyltransferase complex ATPase subunit type 1 TsaE [Rickettsiales bacterium]